MVIYILLDLVLLCGIGFIVHNAVINVRKKRKKKVVRPNMEVFHDPTIRQRTSKYFDKDYAPLRSASLNEDSDVNCFRYAKHDDGNNLMRKRIREKMENIKEDLAVGTATPFEHGGLNLNNSDTTNYLNF